MNDRNRIEVFDFSSDVVVYDLERDAVLTDSLLMKQTAFETFPAFSPDGKKLYFCSAEAKTLPYEFDQVCSAQLGTHVKHHTILLPVIEGMTIHTVMLRLLIGQY